MNLSAARIFVRDLAAAEEFYGERLGLRKHAGGADFGYVVFDTGSVQLVVESVPQEAPNDEQVLVGRFTGLSFAVENIQERYRELLARGVRFTGEPEPQPWGGILATLQDPAANELQLVQVNGAA